VRIAPPLARGGVGDPCTTIIRRAQPGRGWRPNRLFGFFVSDVLMAVLAEFAELQTFFDQFLILARKVIDRFALGALELDHVFL